jgi:hypothetical protein
VLFVSTLQLGCVSIFCFCGKLGDYPSNESLCLLQFLALFFLYMWLGTAVSFHTCLYCVFICKLLSINLPVLLHPGSFTCVLFHSCCSMVYWLYSLVCRDVVHILYKWLHMYKILWYVNISGS